MCMIFLSLLFANILQNGWPPPRIRPGLFIMPGLGAYTIVALIGMARAAPKGYAYFDTHPTAAEVLLIVATWVGVFMWLHSFWVFGIAFWINTLELFVKRDGKWVLNISFSNTAWGKLP